MLESADWGINNTCIVAHNFDLIISRATLVAIQLIFAGTILTSLGLNFMVLVIYRCGRKVGGLMGVWICNLAVADIAMDLSYVSITFTEMIKFRWRYGYVTCPLVKFIKRSAISATIWFDITIAVVRFIALFRPMATKQMKLHIKPIVISIWTASLGLSSFQLYISKKQRSNINCFMHIDVCYERWQDNAKLQGYGAVVTALLLVIPLLVITVLYAVITVKLSKSKKLKLPKKKTLLPATIIFVFVISSLPYRITYILYIYTENLFDLNSVADARLLYAIFFSIHWLMLVSPIANPLIYSLFNKNYRLHSKLLLLKIFPQSPRRNDKIREIFADPSFKPLGNKYKQEMSSFKVRKTNPLI